MSRPMPFLLMVLMMQTVVGGGYLAPSALAEPVGHPAPYVRNNLDPNLDCYERVVPVLQSEGGKLTPAVRNAYLDWAEKSVLQQLRQNHMSVPETCLLAIHHDATLRDAMFGAVFPPDPSIVQNYAQLRALLGEKFLTEYHSLVIAVSLSKRVKGVERADALKNIGRDYQDGFWVDESIQWPGSEPEKAFVRAIAEFIKRTQTPAIDLYQNAEAQAKLRAFLPAQSIPADWIATVKRTVWFGERLKNAMVLLGQRPAAREAKPHIVEWLRHLAALNAAKPSSTPEMNGKPMPWPLFPIHTAPWPLLMPLAHPVPISEANYIWEAFQGQHGPDRYHTYGPYRGDDDLMPDSLRPSRWFWDAWPDRIVHGGMCVPISKGTVDLYTCLCKPAMWAGQPGHANLISFQHVNGLWTAEIEQAFAGGPDVTCAQWYFDEDGGTQLRYRDLYYWPSAEYHLGLALAMNVSLKSYMDTRIAANLFRTLPDEQKSSIGLKLLRSVLPFNPFNPELWYRLALHTSDPIQNMNLCAAAIRVDTSLISDASGTADLVKRGDGNANGQYWRTMAPYVLYYGLKAHPAPKSEEDMQRVYAFLKTVPGINNDDLVGYARKFVANRPMDTEGNDLPFVRSLADKGDVYGQWRLGTRYRDGEGVPQNDAKARELLMLAAGHGDVTAALDLAGLLPSIPSDMIRVTTSSEWAKLQSLHLVDGAGMLGAFHDTEGSSTSWHTTARTTPSLPARGIDPSPAWARFDFARPMKFDAILIWNHNQSKFTDRGFRKARIYGSEDGQTWMPLTASPLVQLPRANGNSYGLPISIPNAAYNLAFKSVIIAAEQSGGNFGGDAYGLSAVRFQLPTPGHVVPAAAIRVTASSVYSPQQIAQHLIDGSGMLGSLHDNARQAETMWHSTDRPAALPPVEGLPASPAWARFDFAQPQRISAILIWNLNQPTLMDRGFRNTRIYGSSDGKTWMPLTASPTIELPRASGLPLMGPTGIVNEQAEKSISSVIIAADQMDGNYGGVNYGLSAVRFVTSDSAKSDSAKLGSAK